MPKFRELFGKMVILNLSQQVNSHFVIYSIFSFSVKDSKRCANTTGCVMFDI